MEGCGREVEVELEAGSDELGGWEMEGEGDGAVEAQAAVGVEVGAEVGLPEAVLGPENQAEWPAAEVEAGSGSLCGRPRYCRPGWGWGEGDWPGAPPEDGPQAGSGRAAPL